MVYQKEGYVPAPLLGGGNWLKKFFHSSSLSRGKFELRETRGKNRGIPFWCHFLGAPLTGSGSGGDIANWKTICKWSVLFPQQFVTCAQLPMSWVSVPHFLLPLYQKSGSVIAISLQAYIVKCFRYAFMVAKSVKQIHCITSMPITVVHCGAQGRWAKNANFRPIYKNKLGTIYPKSPHRYTPFIPGNNDPKVNW